MNNNYRKIIVNSVNISIGEVGAAYHKYFKITNDNGKVGIVDNKDIVIIPSICDSIGLHYATSCYMTLKGIESYCWFISPVAFFAILDEYNKDDSKNCAIWDVSMNIYTIIVSLKKCR